MIGIKGIIASAFADLAKQGESRLSSGLKKINSTVGSKRKSDKRDARNCSFDSIYPGFQPVERFQNLVKGWRCIKEHIPHLLIIPRQFGHAWRWRCESECSRLCQIVTRPASGKEPRFPNHHSRTQGVIRQRARRFRPVRHRRHVGVVPRVMTRHRRFQIAVMLRVQDGCLFPKCPFHLQRHYLATHLRERRRQNIRQPRTHPMLAHRPLQ